MVSSVLSRKLCLLADFGSLQYEGFYIILLNVMSTFMVVPTDIYIGEVTPPAVLTETNNTVYNCISS